MNQLEQEIATAIDSNIEVDVDCAAGASHRIVWRGTPYAVAAILALLRARGLEV